MKKLYQSRTLSLLVILIIYVAAAIAAIAVVQLTHQLHFVVRLLLADIAATLFVWFFGVILKNSSVYDPYWSVAPPVMLAAALWYYGNINVSTVLAVVAISVWSLRLTGNWVYTFQNLNWQDWRYIDYKERLPRMWFVINLLGINLMPTLFVFGGMLPVFALIGRGEVFNAGTLAGFGICLIAVALEFFADLQMHLFRKNADNAGKTNTSGLWAYSRHPNYFGEILFWFGLYFVMLSSAPQYFYLLAAPLCIALMFIFISIPLMENRRLSRRPDYSDYQKTVSALIPFPRKKM